MYTDFDRLFPYRQYIGDPVCYYFDRKTYTICAADSVKIEKEYYERYIPLFQVDEETICRAFILQINNKALLHEFEKRVVCIEEFLQRNGLWNDWWVYYRRTINHIAQQWCYENSLKYISKEL